MVLMMVMVKMVMKKQMMRTMPIKMHTVILMTML